MQLTRIEKENEEFFFPLCPEELLSNEYLLKLGVLDDDDEPACVCVAGACENMAGILWFFTDPKKREKGIGSFMMDGFSDFAKEAGLDGIMVNFSTKDENLDDFLTEAGFLVGDDHYYYRVPISEIVYCREMDVLPDPKKNEPNLFTLADPKGQELFKETLHTHELDPRIFAKISPELCVIYNNPDGDKISGLFLSELEDGDLYVNYMISDEQLHGLLKVIKTLRNIIVSKDITKGSFIFSDRVGKSAEFIKDLIEYDSLEEFYIPDRMQAVKLFV
ncbi:MAG: GNAT family N-acetyltransferase [Lachnospiraceae bacterium]|nr:GNAT family N-acetyltransferase [Lachnospiraceae bacterium]